MTRCQYKHKFGCKDLLCIEERKNTQIRFFVIKTKRSFKEVFLFLDKDELLHKENKVRKIRNTFYIAMLENLPQMLL